MGSWLEVWVELYKDVNMKGQPPKSGWVENLLSLTNLKFGLLVWATLSSPQRTGRREANNVYSDSCAWEGWEHMYQDMCVCGCQDNLKGSALSFHHVRLGSESPYPLQGAIALAQLSGFTRAYTVLYFPFIVTWFRQNMNAN